jgi:hypothetical protein
MNKRCLICEKALQPGLVDCQNATIWTTEGGYDSSVYDPNCGGVFLEAAICDECLVRKKGLIEEVEVTRPAEVLTRRPPDL